MKIKALCPVSKKILLAVLPFICISALFMISYITLADPYLLYVKRSFIYSIFEHIAASICILFGGALFVDYCFYKKDGA